MNNYCEWCQGRFPEEGCQLSPCGKCAWEEDKEEE